MCLFSVATVKVEQPESVQSIGRTIAITRKSNHIIGIKVTVIVSSEQQEDIFVTDR